MTSFPTGMYSHIRTILDTAYSLANNTLSYIRKAGLHTIPKLFILPHNSNVQLHLLAEDEKDEDWDRNDQHGDEDA